MHVSLSELTPLIRNYMSELDTKLVIGSSSLEELRICVLIIFFPVNRQCLNSFCLSTPDSENTSSHYNMAFRTVAKAVQLKNLIDQARHHLPTIGRCVSLELNFRRSFGEEDEEAYRRKKNTRVTKDKKLENLQDQLVSIYRTQGFKMKEYGFEQAKISVLGKDFAAMENILLEDVQKWYSTGTFSGFGNVQKQQTEYNAEVRSSHELDPSQFSVSQELLDDIALKWGKDFAPQSVTVQPYKLVIYGPGDHFILHKDTPEAHLCGTFLITLFQSCSPGDAFEIHQNGDSSGWDSDAQNGWCAFYPDIVHSITPLESGFRAILSFKVFTKEAKAQEEWTMDDALISRVQNVADQIRNLKRPVGILLKHHYGYKSKSLYGCDKRVLDGLKQKGLQVEMKPVLVHFEGTGPSLVEYADKNVQSVSSDVYSLTEEALDFVRKRLEGEKVKRYREATKNLVFLDGHDPESESPWHHEFEEEIEYVGNGCQSHSENSVYVRYAAIVTLKDNMA